jgi:hypothetical protein
MSRGRTSRGLTIADVGGFSFSKITRRDDPLLLPGALKYGGLGGLAALAAPSALVLGGTEGVPKPELSPLRRIYDVAGGELSIKAGSISADSVALMILAR